VTGNGGLSGQDAGSEQDARWKREAEFFDAEEYAEGPIDPITIQRYVELKRPWTNAEYPYSLLGDLTGKKVFEIGCGDGTNSILLALRGAEVHAVDISSRAIAIARERAKLHGLEDRVHFECAPLEQYVLRKQHAFDVIVGFAVLHHVLPVLDQILNDLKKLAHPKSEFLFCEPVAKWHWLRKVRLALPIKVHGTPDERPLNAREMKLLQQHFPRMQTRYFGLTTRVGLRFLPPNYEKAPPFFRSCWDTLMGFDRFLLNTLKLDGLGSTVIVYQPSSLAR
jgi:2-polyprenyl-3-methyl-5-hydroxy-6-metoxy-1,4-benzoquinol methylase